MGLHSFDVNAVWDIVFPSSLISIYNICMGCNWKKQKHGNQLFTCIDLPRFYLFVRINMMNMSVHVPCIKFIATGEIAFKFLTLIALLALNQKDWDNRIIQAWARNIHSHQCRRQLTHSARLIIRSHSATKRNLPLNTGLFTTKMGSETRQLR